MKATFHYTGFDQEWLLIIYIFSLWSDLSGSPVAQMCTLHAGSACINHNPHKAIHKHLMIGNTLSKISFTPPAHGDAILQIGRKSKAKANINTLVLSDASNGTLGMVWDSLLIRGLLSVSVPDTFTVSHAHTAFRIKHRRVYLFNLAPHWPLPRETLFSVGSTQMNKLHHGVYIKQNKREHNAEIGSSPRDP